MQTFSYSPEDEAIIRSRQWRVMQHGYVRATVALNGERFLHRILLRPKPGQEVDHVNGNPRDNRRENLRLATRSTNGFNRKMPARALPRGVSFHVGKYQASIRVQRRLLYLGRFATCKEAAEAYRAAALRYFGQVAP